MTAERHGHQHLLYQASATGLKTALVSRPEGDTEPQRPAAVALPAAGLIHRWRLV
jgi:hypothetical protein